jgi:hypothetical protein
MERAGKMEERTRDFTLHYSLPSPVPLCEYWLHFLKLAEMVAITRLWLHKLKGS